MLYPRGFCAAATATTLLTRTPTRRRHLPWTLLTTRRCYEILIDPQTLLGSNKSKQRKKKHQREGSRKPSYRFIDKTRIRVAGGPGGKGSLSVESLGRKRKFRPDGGHGGNGGSVILLADPSEQSLRWSHPSIQAEKGANGTSQEMVGRNGRNRIVRVPCGVVVHKILHPPSSVPVIPPLFSDDDTVNDNQEEEEDDDDGYDYANDNDNDEEDDDFASDDDEEAGNDEAVISSKRTTTSSTMKDAQGIEYFAIDDSMLEDEFLDVDAHMDDDDGLSHTGPTQKQYLIDLDKPGAYIVVAKGGKGGYGSMMYSSSGGPLPKPHILTANARPNPGEVVHLELELKLIADIGLVGFPNAGKSSLLRAMSRATPEVAPYPFTTLHPLMGVVEYRDGTQIKVADIPGLIAGASQGRGKGIDFLRHVERTKALCYMLDVAGTEGRDPHEDLRVLVDELSSYAEGVLLDRSALVVANKTDLIEPERLQDLIMSIQETADSLGITRWSPVVGISAAVTGHGLETLSKDMRSIVEQFRSVEEPVLQGA